MEVPQPVNRNPAQQQERIAALERENRELREQLAAALAEIERLKRAGKRQATPFSTGERKAHPKKPGRKRGQGRFTRRLAPPPEQVVAEVPVPLEVTVCDTCGGELTPDPTEMVSITDVPPVQPQSVLYHLAAAHCTDCGLQVRATHPAVAPDQRGATAHRLGERFLALGHWLHYGMGVPVRFSRNLLPPSRRWLAHRWRSAWCSVTTTRHPLINYFYSIPINS